MADETKKRMGKAAFALFVILILASASVMVVALQEASPDVKGDVMVDAEGILQAFLTSTVNEVSYTDEVGDTNVYVAWTVHDLLVEDMELRTNSTATANLTNIEDGIEATLSGMLEGIAGGHHYNLKVSLKDTFFRIRDLDLEGGARSTAKVPMRTVDGDATVTLSLTE